MRRRVAVTGMGMVTPLGPDLSRSWEALLEGRSGVGPIRRFDASTLPVDFAAEVDDLEGAEQGALKLELTRRALSAAIEQAGPLRADPRRLGVSVGSEAARPELPLIAQRLAERRGASPEEILRGMPSAPTRLAAELIGAEGPLSTVSTACTSSSQAIGEAAMRIRRGDADVMVAGGVDILVDPLMISGFSLLGALSTRREAPAAASRPFDQGRDGFVLGEGAGFMILEEWERARERGAEILAELSGWGCSCNAYRITDSPPDGRGAAQAMQAALLDSRVPPEAVGYINAHGTSTQMNDASETRGIRSCFGDWGDQIRVSSTKSMTGHLVAACGAVEAIITVLALREGRLPPTINLEQVDPECVLNHVAQQTVELSVEHAMTNAFGFGGSNGSLLFSRPEGS